MVYYFKSAKYLTETEYESVDYINFIQDKMQWLALWTR